MQWETCETVTVTLIFNKHDLVSALRFILFLIVGSRPVSHCTLCDFIHVRSDEEGFSLRHSLFSFILLNCCQFRSTERRILSVLWILVLCLVYSRTRKEQFTSTMWVFETPAPNLQLYEHSDDRMGTGDELSALATMMDSTMEVCCRHHLEQKQECQNGGSQNGNQTSLQRIFLARCETCQKLFKYLGVDVV